ncbi:MAG: hypothetical protein IJS29_01045 [Selenomonadaceae bacterium]|nr:hypothetical protein [Selenomonadaceae bacterium]
MTDAVVNFFIDKVVPELEKLMENFVMIVITVMYFFYVRYKKFKDEEIDDFVTFLDRLEWFLLGKMEVLSNDIEKNIAEVNQKSIADKSEYKN